VQLERRAERVRLGVEAGLPEDGGGTLAELLQWWLDTYSKPLASHATNESAIRVHFLGNELAPLPLTAVTSGRIESFLQAKTGEVSPQMVNHLRGYLSRAFTPRGERDGTWDRTRCSTCASGRFRGGSPTSSAFTRSRYSCERSIRAGVRCSRRRSTRACGRASSWRSGSPTWTSSARS
jgi:hypothetical protein